MCINQSLYVVMTAVRAYSFNFDINIFNGALRIYSPINQRVFHTIIMKRLSFINKKLNIFCQPHINTEGRNQLTPSGAFFGSCTS